MQTPPRTPHDKLPASGVERGICTSNFPSTSKASAIKPLGLFAFGSYITNTAGQAQLMGKPADTPDASVASAVKQSIATSTTTTEVQAKRGAIENNFDKDAVQSEIDLQVKVTQQFDKNRQTVKKDIYAAVKEKQDEARRIRLSENDGYDTDESRQLDAEAEKLKNIAKWIDIGAIGLYGWGNTDVLLAGGLATQADLARQAAISGGHYYQQTCDSPNVNCTYREVTLDQIKPSDRNNLITVSNPGILNALPAALSNASKQNSADVNQGGIIVIDNPPTGTPVAELLYAAYDKLNDLIGAHLPLTAAEQANQDLYLYAQNNNYSVDLSNHSRGGITASVALQNLNNNRGITGLPINDVRFYGTATNVQRYANQLFINGSGRAYSAVHQSDFVGIPIGGNSATGGTCWLCYSHSSYYYDMPPETITVGGETKENPAYIDYVKKWGSTDSKASQPKYVAPTVTNKGVLK